MELRDKFNRDIVNRFGQYSKEILDIPQFTQSLRPYRNVIIEGFYNLRYIFDYENEGECILEELLDGIKNFDTDRIVNICDSYEYKFIDLYDYIIKNLELNMYNYDKLYNVFSYVLLNTRTINGINLSIFMLYILGSPNIYSISRALLYDDIDYIEVLSYISNEDYRGRNIYFNIFSYRYRNKSLIDLLKIFYSNGINLNKTSYYISVFYLFNMSSEKTLDSENDIDLFLDFLYNFKCSVEGYLKKFVYKLRFSVSKLYRDMELCMRNNGLYSMNICSLSFLYRYVRLLTNEKRIQLRDRLCESIDKTFLEHIENMDVKNTRYMVELLNSIDLDISGYLDVTLRINYENIEFHKFILFNMRNYRYLNNIVNKIEDISYLSYLIRDDRFTIILLRVLVILYSNHQDNRPGIRFLRVIMEYKELYFEYRLYINYLLTRLMSMEV